MVATRSPGQAATDPHTGPEAAKVELLERAADAAVHQIGSTHRDREQTLALLRAYYRHVAPDDLLGRDPVDVAGAVLSQADQAAHRVPGRAAVRVYSPDAAEHGWSCPHSVVEIVSDDMPFLVDSITNAITATGLGIHLVVHPQVVVRRDLAGNLLEVLAGSRVDGDTGMLRLDALAEAWIHAEIDRVSDRERLAQLTDRLGQVLDDVRVVVEDWRKMRDNATAVADELHAAIGAGTLPLPDAAVREARDLIRWLADDHFTFIGYRQYEFARVEVTDADGGPREEEVLRPVPATGLGVLRSDATHSRSFARLTPAGRELARAPELLVLTKANAQSTIHRPVYLDYVGIKTFGPDGRVTGERRFLGLYTSEAYLARVSDVPVIRRKAAEILARSGFPRSSHGYRDVVTVLESFPRDEMFTASTDDLFRIVMGIVQLQERGRLRVFLRRDPYGRYWTVLVYLPRDRYTTANRLKIQRILLDQLAGASIEHSQQISASVLARLQFTVHVDPAATPPAIDVAALEAELENVTRDWDDDLAAALVDTCGEAAAGPLYEVWGHAFPEGYKEDFSARQACADLLLLADLPEGDELALNLYRPVGAAPGDLRFKIYRRGGRLSLSQVLPVLQHLGVEVVDERPYALAPTDDGEAYIYDFGLRHTSAAVTEQVGSGTLRTHFQDAFAACWRGRAEVDYLNALVVEAGVTWRQVTVLRMYARYLRQVGIRYSDGYLVETLRRHPRLARRLVDLFDARLDPAFPDDREAAQQQISREITTALDQVPSLEQDLILRRFLAVVCATWRTNHFQPDAGGAPKPYTAVKIDPSAVPDLPAPCPKYEIFVYAPRFEGVHLRFGAVARGGLRWSDRREDFRTEILSLVKAQMVKNAVIVPVGAKGGFVLKRPPAAADRDALLAEGVACYTMFVSALLDLTDNLVDGRVVPPPYVVRHDGDDPYLVVAADKGTATFSDLANEVSARYGFWLGDAFASGGSDGYDHKAMGITARGAWESVERHFREVGVDTRSQDFTVVGIGDMSGDVFGNGMLLSEHIRLVAAFDHRHVFLDPDPDPPASYAQRRRLYDLPRSSWGDYAWDLISPGGGVWPRSAKAVPISPQVRARLGIAEEADTLTPTELIRAVLAAPVDLLWNGGIGTYVKASTESHAAAGDRANDAVRVDGRDLRCRVVGEGGNLGLTQAARIEYALAGGRIDTDAIDNSAGVDTSDHEVNLKILLDRVVADGDLTAKQRNALLASMTDEVAALVLADNYDQNVLLGNARAQAAAMVHVHARLIRALEASGHVDRALEGLPDDTALARRRERGQGLTSPELAVIAAWEKISFAESVLASGLPDEPWSADALQRYFPAEIVRRFPDRLAAHPLSREIITTVVVNDMVNRGGTTFAFRAMEETGASVVEVARAAAVSTAVFDLDGIVARVTALDHQVPTAAQTAVYLEVRRLLDRATRWFLTERRATIDVRAEVARFRDPIAELAPAVPAMLLGAERARMDRRAAELAALGAPADLAARAAALLDEFGLLDVIEVAAAARRDPREVAQLYFAVSERYQGDRLLTRITDLPRLDRWQALARSSLRADLYGALARLTAGVLAGAPPGVEPEAAIAFWEERNAEGLARARATLEEIVASDAHDLATLSVALRSMRSLVGQSVAGGG